MSRTPATGGVFTEKGTEIMVSTTRRTGTGGDRAKTKVGDGEGWLPVCDLADLIPDLGTAALIDGEQVAVFSCRDGRVYAVQQADPRADGANVMSHGIVGSKGDAPTLASPLHKELYDLRTGACIDPKGAEPTPLRTWPVRVEDGLVEIRGGRASAAGRNSHALGL